MLYTPVVSLASQLSVKRQEVVYVMLDCLDLSIVG